MNSVEKLFGRKKPVIGMIHADPLPGTPLYKGSVKEILENSIKDAESYQKAGIDSIMIENMHDIPYLKHKIGEEITTLMSIIGYEIKKITGLPTGIQILAGANKQAVAAANSAGLDFIRAEGFVFAHVADEGIFESDAGELLRYRKAIGADNILIFTDIKKKHSSHSITADISLAETAKAAEFFLSDCLIITGSSTGAEANIEDIYAARNNTELPVFVGSGITSGNVEKYYNNCDGLIVGSHFKKGGYWANKVDFGIVKNFMDKINLLRTDN